MVHLTLAGLSGDGRRLLLVSDAGVEFTLDVDQTLRAALRGEHARIGQLEIKMESSLRPRDIQARIRSGETPDAVAQAAQTTVDRIMVYAGPVLAERAHVAERAQRSSVRRKAGDGGARTLGEAVLATLQPEGVNTSTVEWDAWRREDGRWMLTATYAAGTRKGEARFVFDMPGNYVTCENDDARWLVGEGSVTAETAPPARDDLQRARSRRLSAAPDELPLGDDVIELVSEDSPVEAYLEPAPADEHPGDDPDSEPTAEVGLDILDPRPRSDGEPEATEEPAEPAPKRPAKKRGRASVPSWDEIMFGGGKSE